MKAALDVQVTLKTASLKASGSFLVLFLFLLVFAWKIAGNAVFIWFFTGGAGEGNRTLVTGIVV
jgi:hypothetical protein